MSHYRARGELRLSLDLVRQLDDFEPAEEDAGVFLRAKVRALSDARRAAEAYVADTETQPETPLAKRGGQG